MNEVLHCLLTRRSVKKYLSQPVEKEKLDAVLEAGTYAACGMGRQAGKIVVLQNPDDIDHFRRIIPMQARRLLDQVTILSSGEAIVFGSAFHIPTRVQFDRPEPGPYSQTAAPYHEWSKEKTPFPLGTIIDAWGA